MIIDLADLNSPIGRILLAVRERRLCVAMFGAAYTELEEVLARIYGSFEPRKREDPAGAITSLRAYFSGVLDAIEQIDVAPAGTEFQRKVWSQLRKTKPGETISYGRLASKIGSPRAVRAVGAANGANPIAIVIPCHRVVGADGGLVGYGGGIERKQWLLGHEGAWLPLGD